MHRCNQLDCYTSEPLALTSEQAEISRAEQTTAWEAVNAALIKAGMLEWNSDPNLSERERAVAFIEYLAARQPTPGYPFVP